MSAFHNRFKTAATTAAEGVWVGYPANSDGSVPAFKLARSGRQNQKYAEALTRYIEKYRDDMTGKPRDLSPEEQKVAESDMVDLFCRTVLLDWRNFQPNDDGVALPFSVEAAAAILNDLDWSDLYIDLQQRANNASNFKAKTVKAEAKNS